MEREGKRMNRLVVRTFWIRPHSSGRPLPPAGPRMRAVFEVFLEAFPEYMSCLAYTQSPRPPHELFVYVSGCGGLFPCAAEHLARLLKAAFPKSRVLPYGRPFREPSGR